MAEKRTAKVVTNPSEDAMWAATKLDPDNDGNIKCPFCPWTPTFGDLDAQKNSVGHHLDKEHATKLAFARLHWKELGWAAYEKLKEMETQEEEELFNPGLAVGEGDDTFDFLYVANEIKDKVRGRGGVLRWCTGKNVQRYKDRGMQVVDRGQAEMPSQASHEDTLARSNELYLMEIPAKLNEQRVALKKQKVRDQGDTVGRLEDLQNSQSDLGRSAYDHYRKQGMPHENSMRLSRNVENRVASGDVDPGPAPGENRYTHRR